MNRALPFCLLAAVGLPAQGDPPPERPAPKAVAAAVAAALEIPQRSERVEVAVRAVLDAQPPMLAELGQRLRDAQERDAKAPPDADRGPYHALRHLVEQVALGFVKRGVDSEMFYAGQYDELRVLQPHIGEFFFGLVIDPPDWFHDDHRPWIVTALRDLQTGELDEQRLGRLRAIAEDEDFETERLRDALVYALAQWGDRELAERRLAAARRGQTAGDAEDRHAALQREASIQYLLRDYAAAAGAHQRYLRSAETAGLPITPEGYYNAACCLSLAGDQEAAFAELDRCVELMRTGRVDASLMLERKLFETDRDLAALRGTPRFAALLERAFARRQEARE
jgi:tetratricopeptide (TPR) repeat protein